MDKEVNKEKNHKFGTPISNYFPIILSNKYSYFSSFTSEIDGKIYKNDAAKRQTGTLESPPTNSKKADGKVVCLTFDDGPSSATDDILETLQKHDAKATFFMLSPNMKERSNVVKRVVEEEHGVGMDGVTHDVNRFYQSNQTVLGEMNEAQKVLESITGIHSVLIRTPYGSVPYLTKPFRKALNTQGYEMWDWNIDSNDWVFQTGSMW